LTLIGKVFGALTAPAVEKHGIMKCELNDSVPSSSRTRPRAAP
jgi:hypothetical protein